MEILRLTEEIENAKSYVDLPYHRVMRSSFQERPFHSYGIIAYSKESKKWLLVKRQYSPSYIVLFRGVYRLSDLKMIITTLSHEEVSMINNILFDSGESQKEKFFKLYQETIFSGNAEYAYSRFVDSSKCLEELLPEVKEKETEWLWPKGKLIYSQESQLECAQREFQEETGISVSEPLNPRLISNRPLLESFRGFNGRLYESKYWIYVFDSHQDPPILSPRNEKNSTREISNRQWFTEEEAKLILDKTKFNLLLEAKKLIILKNIQFN